MVHGDIADIARIEHEVLSPWSANSLAAELKVPNGCQFVAEVNTSIAGWCCCRMIAPEAELLKLVVRKEYRRQGVASLLLGRLVEELRRQKIESLFLEVRAANRGATAFYRQQAFSRVGGRSRYYSNPPDSALIFCRSIR